MSVAVADDGNRVSKRVQWMAAAAVVAVVALVGAWLQRSIAPLSLLASVAGLAAYAHPRWRPWLPLAVLLSAGLCCVLIGHPESALWMSLAVLVSYVFGEECRNSVDGLRTAARRADDRAEQFNCVDFPTGTFNKVGLGLVAPPVIHAARRRGDAVYVASIQVDGVADFAAREGQEAAVGLVKEVADTLRVTVRSSDLVSRTGETQFHVVGPGRGVTAAGLQSRCRTLMLHRHDPVLSRWSGQLRVAITVLAPWDDDVDLATLLARADTELEMQSAVPEATSPR